MANPIAIKSSVGEAAVNLPDDVGIVQMLLNQNRPRIRGMRELREEKLIGPKTIAAIRQFQTDVLHFREVDGVVDPGGKTFNALVSGVGPSAPATGHPNPAPAPCAGPPLDEPIFFPLKNRRVADYHPPRERATITHHRYFGAARKDKSGGYRAHAACDLLAAPGTAVFAVADGTFFYKEIGYYDITDAVSFKHDNGLVVRYGEITIDPTVLSQKGAVAAGQKIGEVAKNSFGTAMLHIEFYAGTMDGRLSMPGNIFKRRGDLIDPTTYLDNAQSLP